MYARMFSNFPLESFTPRILEKSFASRDTVSGSMAQPVRMGMLYITMGSFTAAAISA